MDFHLIASYAVAGITEIGVNMVFFTLFLVLFIDGMGLGLLFPILNSIIIDPSSSFLAADTSVAWREILYGIVVSIFMLCWFFGAAILGDLSDSIGRKRTLLICLIGACLGYLICAISIVINSISLLIIGRMVAGFTAGSQPIAQAAIVDISPEEHKTRNLGFIILALALGFVLGPTLGGVLSESSWVSWFGYTTPLFFAAIMALVNVIWLWCAFTETRSTKARLQIKWHHAINIFVSAFKHPNIRYLSVTFLLMNVGWGGYFSFIAMFLLHRFGYSSLYVSLFLALLGVGFSVGCGLLVDRLSQRYPKCNIVGVCYLIASMAVVATYFLYQAIWVWYCGFVIACAIAVGYATHLAIFSGQVTADEQGWVMGVTGSIGALCFGLSALMVGIMASVGADMPMLVAGIFLLMAGISLFWIPLSKQPIEAFDRLE